MPVSPMGTPLPYADPQAGDGGGDLAALLAGAGAGEAAPEGAAPGGGDSEDFARSMLDLINEWRQVEADEEDLLLIEKISSMVQTLIARNAKEGQDALQGKLSPRLLARAYAP